MSTVISRNYKYVFVLCLFVSCVFLWLYRTPNYSPKFSLAFLEPWEQSLPGDRGTCRKYLPLLLAPSSDEGNISSQIFSWPTPNFLDLLLEPDLKDYKAKVTQLRKILCARYDGGRHSGDVDILTSSAAVPSLASAEQTHYRVIGGSVKVGGVIRLEIVVRGGGMGAEGVRGGGRVGAGGGGDFFRVRAEQPETKSSVAASRITYKGSGKYEVEFKTFWAGRHKFKLAFGQSGHFVDLLKRLTSKDFSYGSEFTGVFQNSKYCSNSYSESACKKLAAKVKTRCFISEHQIEQGKKICNFSRGRGEEWFCNKPGGDLTCGDLYAVHSKRSQNSLDILKLFPKYDRATTERKTISGNPAFVFVKKSDAADEARSKLPKCTSGLKTPQPAGYWLNGFWVSTVCRNVLYTAAPALMAECIQGRTFYFIGDSTARQWFEYFLSERGAFNAREITSYTDVWEPRTAVIDDLGTTFHYRSQGQPLQNGGPYFATQFTSEQLDQFPILPDRGAKLTIVIALGPHFLLYNPDVYLKRMIAVRESALKLIQRNPHVTVIFKGPNTFDRGVGIGECCLSDWLSYRQHRLAKHVFDGSPVVYLDVWDMTVSHNSPDLVHPVKELIANELNMALSFTCSLKR